MSRDAPADNIQDAPREIVHSNTKARDVTWRCFLKMSFVWETYSSLRQIKHSHGLCCTLDKSKSRGARQWSMSKRRPIYQSRSKLILKEYATDVP